MLKTRVLAALVFAPALLWLLLAGGEPLRLVLFALSMTMLWEALRLLVPYEPRNAAVWVASFVAGAAIAAVSLSVVPAYLAPSPAGLVVLMLLATMFAPVDNTQRVAHAAGALLAVGYSCALLPNLYNLRQHPTLGVGLALMALFCTWGGDTGAYFAGRAFGRHKLMPAISPGKTVEGALGGVLTGPLVALLLRFVLKLPMETHVAIVIGAVAATAGIVGDLAESLLKRAAGKKDSSHLIPGHGGVLDRFDGVLFAAWAVHLVARVLVPTAGLLKG